MSAPVPERDGSDPPRLAGRRADGHKGTFGTVVVVGGCSSGSVRMIGAPALAARGALRAGAGLCRVLAPAPLIEAVLTICPSATGVALPTDGEGELVAHESAARVDAALSGARALAIGPGLGRGDAVEALVLRALGQEEVAVVADADALHALAALAASDGGAVPVRAPAVLTPHMGEFRALAAALRVAGDAASEGDRPGAAAALARRTGCVVVLKGRGTVVTDGHRAWVCARGTAALATAGTGDVLTGAIAGVIAQHHRAARGGEGVDLYDAARVGVLAHALAGEAWVRSRGAAAGLLAEELADELPAVFEALRGG